MALSFTGPWGVLGIEPTQDEREIRRAYARKLKVTNPEDNPAGFQALRAAYERALFLAPYVGQDDDYDYEDAYEPDPEPPAPPEPLGNRVAPMPSVVGDRPVGQPQDQSLDLSTSAPELRPADAVLGDRPAGAPPEAVPDPGAGRDLIHPPEVVVASPPDVFPDPPADEEAQHRALCDTLLRTVQDEAAWPAVVRAALDAVLSSPAMDAITVHDRTEQWLASLAIGGAPQGAALIEPLIAHFHWSEDQLGWRPEWADAVFALRREMALGEAVLRSNHPQYRAYHALTQRPAWLRTLQWRLEPGLADEVRELLTTLRLNWPKVMQRLTPASVAWWDRFLERPQFSLALVVSVFIVTLIGIGAWASSGENPGFRTDQPWAPWLAGGLLVAAPAGVAFCWLYAVQRMRWWWAESDTYNRPLWLRIGWAPAALVPVLISALAPPAPWLLASLFTAGLAIAYWALVTGEPDRQPQATFGGALRFLVGLGHSGHWLVRSLFAFFYLGVFWLTSPSYLPAPIWAQIGLTLIPAALTMVLGAVTLQKVWAWELRPRQREALAAMLLLVCGAALFLTSVGEGHGQLPAIGLTLAAMAVLVHKAPASSLPPPAYLARDLAMRFGWILAFIASIQGPSNAKPPLWPGVLWLLSGTIITGLVILASALPKPKPQPAKSKRKPFSF